MRCSWPRHSGITPYVTGPSLRPARARHPDEPGPAAIASAVILLARTTAAGPGLASMTITGETEWHGRAYPDPAVGTVAQPGRERRGPRSDRGRCHRHSGGARGSDTASGQ